MRQKNLSESTKMFKISQTDSLYDRMFELVIHAKVKACVFPTSFTVILSAVAFNFNFELIMYITIFVSKVQAAALICDLYSKLT